MEVTGIVVAQDKVEVYVDGAWKELGDEDERLYATRVASWKVVIIGKSRRLLTTIDLHDRGYMYDNRLYETFALAMQGILEDVE